MWGAHVKKRFITSSFDIHTSYNHKRKCRHQIVQIEEPHPIVM